MVERGVGNLFLECVCVKIGVADFYGYASGKFLFAAQVEGQSFGHTKKGVVETLKVGGILVEGGFVAHRFFFGIRDDGGGVYAVGPAPEHQSVFSQQALHHVGRYLAEGFYGCDAHAAEGLVGFSPMPGILLMGKGARKGLTSGGGTSFSPLGLATPVAIFATVLLTDSPNDMGSPVFLMMVSRSS